MAIVFDMTSGSIQSENEGVTRVADQLDPIEIGLALQTVCETPAMATPREAAIQHIRELLKKT